MQYADQAETLANLLMYEKGQAYSCFVRGKNVSNNRADTLSIVHFKKAVEIAKRGGLKDELADYMGMLGMLYFKTGDIEKAIRYLTQANGICLTTNNKRALSRSYGSLGILYTNLGDYVKALDCYDHVLKICSEIKDERNEAASLNNTGAILFHIGDYAKAQEYFFEALKIKERIGEPVPIVNSYINIGNVIAKQGDEKSAFEYMEKALDLAQKSGDKLSIGNCYEELGEFMVGSDKEAALEYFNQALKYGRELVNGVLTVSNLINIGNIYLSQEKLADASSYFSEALALAQKSYMIREVGVIWLNLGNISLKQKKYGDALNFTLKSLEIATGLKSKVQLKDCHEQLYKIYEVSGDYKNAFANLKDFKTYSDSVFNEKNIRQSAEQEYLYKLEVERQEMEAERQKKEEIVQSEQKLNRSIIIILASGIIVVSILLVFLLRSYRQKKRINSLLAAQKAEIEEMNSQLKVFNEGKDKFFGILAHDLKGSFNSILGFSNLLSSPVSNYSVDEVREMSQAINSSAINTYKLLENLLTWSRTNVGIVGFNPVCFKFCDVISANKSEWESNAAQKNVSIKFSASGDCTLFADRDMVETIVRNLIANAIKFSNDGGNIEVVVSNQDDGIQVSVCDTGIGMSQEDVDALFVVGLVKSRPGTHQEPGTGLGLLICNEFVKRHNGKIWVESKVGEGSKFMFHIPSVV
jgi:signal transduction histidine kinase/Flp pilus assembly protein TadD